MTPPHQRTVYIYGLRESGTTEYRYVGRTAQPKARMTAHLSSAQEDTEKWRWVKSLQDRGVAVEMDILQECDDSSWLEAERDWIKRCKREGHRLTNRSEGGDGFHGATWTDGPESRYPLRIPTPLKERLTAIAKAERRSLNSVIVRTLAASLANEKWGPREEAPTPST